MRLASFCEHKVRCSKRLAASLAGQATVNSSCVITEAAQLHLEPHEVPFLLFRDHFQGWTLVGSIFLAYFQLQEPLM